jgi:hypothetical protein
MRKPCLGIFCVHAQAHRSDICRAILRSIGSGCTPFVFVMLGSLVPDPLFVPVGRPTLFITLV